MMRQSELKKKYDPDTGKYTRQHIWSGERSIYGEGIISFGTNLFEKTTANALLPKKPDTNPSMSKKAGDKIVNYAI